MITFSLDTGIMTVLPVSMCHPVQAVQQVQQIPANLNFQIQQQQANQTVEIPMVAVGASDSTNALQQADNTTMNTKHESNTEDVSGDENGQLNIQDSVDNNDSDIQILS